MAILQTNSLTLRPCRPADRNDFITRERDAEVMRFLNGGHQVDRTTLDPDAPFLMPNGTEPHVWTTHRTGTGAFVGWFCLWPETENRAELGYRLRREDWGQGLASEGAMALVDWGFNSVGYDKIDATTMAMNHASRRVMEKIGMRYERTEHGAYRDPIAGSEHGDVWYAVTRAQWMARNSRTLKQSIA